MNRSRISDICVRFLRAAFCRHNPAVSVLNGWRGFGPRERRAIPAENDSYNKVTGQIFLNEIAGYLGAKDL
jgi:hypothetical protein